MIASASKSLLRNLAPFAASVFYLDTRSLALFRVVLGFASLLCCVQFLSFTDAFIWSDGVAPLTLAGRGSNLYSLFFFSDSAGWQLCLFLVTTVLSVLMMIGIGNRWTTLLLWLLQLSIETRYLVAGGTVSIRMGLLWAFFLPLYARPLRSVLERSPGATKVFNAATIGLFVHASLLYFCAYLHKDVLEWGVAHTALYNNLWWGGHTTWFGQWLREFPEFTMHLTAAAYWLEFSAAALILCPVWFIRLFGVVALIGMHLGILAVMDLGDFPVGNLAIALAFIPSQFWDRVSGRSALPGNALITFGGLTLRGAIVPALITVGLIWNQLGIFRVTSPPATSLYALLAALRIENRWDMFSGGGEYITYWPIVKGTTVDGGDLDVWRWYLRKPFEPSDVRYEVHTEIPSDVSVLFPNIRWHKILTAITLYRGAFEGHQKQFLTFLCRRYLERSGKPLQQVSLHWGWRKLNGLNHFDPPRTGELRTLSCADENEKVLRRVASHSNKRR